MLDLSGRVALATDFNPGSSPTQSLNFVGLLARLEMKMTLPEVLAAYCLNSAYALGLEQKLGSLTKGKSASFCALSCGWDELFYSNGEHPVLETWVNGSRIFKKS